MKRDRVLNITSDSGDWRAHALSNFPCFPFMLDKQLCASVEGFIQGIKFEMSDYRRREAFAAWGRVAKAMGAAAGNKHVWWLGREIPYGSPDHRHLIYRALRAKIYYNTGVYFALVSSDGLTLTHDVGPESVHTSLPAEVFCRMLTDLRIEAVERGKIGPP